MFKVINGGQLPTRATKYSACVDLYANEDVTIGAGETALINLGVCIDLDSSNVYKTSDYRFAEKKQASKETLEVIKKQELSDFKREHYLQLMLRSSLSKELIIANGVGVIDLDYKDEIMVRVHKPIDFFTMAIQYYEDTIIKKGERVAQITLLEHKSWLFGIDSEEERVGGFGSTGER